MSTKPLLAITMGDPAGIGPEIAGKIFTHERIFSGATPFVIGSAACLESYASLSGLDLDIRRVSSLSDLAPGPGRVEVYEPCSVAPDFEMGKICADCGKASVGFFEAAVNLALEGRVQGVVTCPINKEAVHLAGFDGDIGHQEILARMTGAELTATMLMTTGLKVAHLSTHKSLSEAVAYVKKPVLLDKLRLTADSLTKWGLTNPKIAVAALNPHGGEGGMLGSEEIDEIEPAVSAARAEGLNVHGPFPADSVFYRAVGGEFDAVMALFHDQGHIAIKVHDFDNSVTATMGIPFIRTSVDHGTAFDIAGKNCANESSLLRAVATAIDMMNGKLK